MEVLYMDCKELEAVLVELKKAQKRYMKDSHLSERSAVIVAQMLGELANTAAEEKEEGFQHTLEALQQAFMERDLKVIDKGVGQYQQYLDEKKKMIALQQVFQTDVELINTKDQLCKDLQTVVDMDLAASGKLSKQVKEILELYQMYLDEKGQVISNQTEGSEIKPDQKIGNRIYLYVRPMGRKTFLDTINSLKSKGAKYDVQLKAWYITDQMDLNQFAAYLGRPMEELKQRMSLKEKLEEKKKEAASQTETPFF